jgi:putative hydrolase of the HAD superfamily
VSECWRDACAAHATRFAPLETAVVADAIKKTSRWYWSDAERHRAGRLELDAARREVVRLALVELGVEERSLAADIGDAYSHQRDVFMQALPEAIDTVRWLRESGRRLALLTNGGGPAQRKKIVRFGLAELFDVVLIEGELGFGKPDERVYHRALDVLNVKPSEAWMAGDNLEWDVGAPQKLGLAGVWIDARGRGVPHDGLVQPDYVVRSLSALRSLIALPV